MMKKRTVFFLLGFACVLFFFLFTLVVRSDILRTIDFTITVKIQDKIPVKSYHLFYFATELARFEVVISVVVVLLAIKRQWKLLLYAVVLLFAGHMLEYVGKVFLNQPPPPFMFYKVPNNTTWFPAAYSIEGNSYPSGHAMRAVFIAGLLGFVISMNKRINRVIQLACYGMLCMFAGLVILGKVVLGQHWTTDVIAGTLLGVGIFLLWLSVAANHK